MFAHIVQAQPDRLHVGVDQVFLGAEHLGDHGADDLDIDPGQPGHRADIGHVLHQHAGARIVELLVAHARQRHADGGDILARMQVRSRPGRVVEQETARRDFRQVLLVGLRIHGDDQIGLARAREIAVPGDADLVPGRQALDVGREEVLAHHGHAHTEDRLGQQPVGRGRAGAVHIADLDHEVVHTHFARRFNDVLHSAATFPASLSTCGMKMSASCMSHAAVGQRSAHRPQCRQRFSSFTITRPVSLRGSET